MMSRLRLVITDDGASELQQARVMVRQRVFWVVLLSAFLALLCLPAYRGLLCDQAYGAVTRQPPEWAKVGVSLTGVGRPRLQRVLREHPGDRDLQLGAMLLGDWRIAAGPEQGFQQEAIDLGSPRLNFLRDLTAQYPNDPVVLATYLRYCTQNGVKIQRPESDPKSAFKPIAPSVLRQFEACCLRGAELDPDNGYFPTLLAVVRYAAGHDEGALAALHQASLATRWADYSEAEMAGGRALLIQAYGDRGPVLHAGPLAGVLLPHLAQIRSVARVAVFQADQRLARGELRSGHAIHADLIRLGRLMRMNAKLLIGRLVGGAVEAIGLRMHKKPGTSFSSVAARNAERRAAWQYYLRRVAREAPEYAAEVERANREQEVFIPKREELSAGGGFWTWDNLLNGIVWREILGLSLAANLGVCLLMWGAAALLGGLRWRRGAAGPTLAAWLWRRSHPLIRIFVFTGLGLAAAFIGMLAVTSDDAVIRWLVPAFALPLLLPMSSTHDTRPVSVRSLLGVTGGVVLAAAAFTLPWSLPELQLGWWHDVVVSATLNGDSEAVTEIGNTAFAYWLPSGYLLMLVLPALVVGFGVLRRWSLPGSIERVRLVAKGLAGVLAVGYLAYLLIAVPGNQRDSRTWDRLIEQESQGFPV